MHLRLTCSGVLLPVALLFPQIWTIGGSTTKTEQKQQNRVTPPAKLPLVINTWEFREANAAAWATLNRPHRANTALDALVNGCSECERLQCDGTVGYGGSPDESGETTLDAMVMDGATMNIGAVAALRQVKDAIRVARHVLEHTRHTLLAGELASDFAEAMGFPRESLSTKKSRAMWAEWREKACQPNFWRNVVPDPAKNCGPYAPVGQPAWNDDGRCYDLAEGDERLRYEFGERNHDTIGMIVVDAEGHIFAGTSTNGARHKIPGRVGDSPIPGAGAYADNEVGAAVATGDGDVMMRFLPSLLAVEAMRGGRSPDEAAQAAMKRIVRFYPDFSGGLVVVDRYGNYSAACVGMDRFPFSVVYGGPEQRTNVEVKECIREQL